MNITLYNVSDNALKVSKNLGAGTTITNVIPTDGTTILDPTFKLSSEKVPTSFNYCYVPAWNRWYFIKNIAYDIGQVAYITCHVDVLYTYKNKLNDPTFNFVRGVNKVNEVDDGLYPLSDYELVRTYRMDGWDELNVTANDTNYLLQVVGYMSRDATSITVENGSVIIYQKWVYSVEIGETGNLVYLYENPAAQGKRVANGTIVKVKGYGNYIFRGSEADTPQLARLDPQTT